MVCRPLKVPSVAEMVWGATVSSVAVKVCVPMSALTKVYGVGASTPAGSELESVTVPV